MRTDSTYDWREIGEQVIITGLFLWRSARTCHHPVGGKHIAGVYIFEARPAGWTGIEDCLCPR
jgi:hypothetical protein